MKKIFLLLISILFLSVISCDKVDIVNIRENDIENPNAIFEVQITDIGCLTDNIIIGKKLENPYSIRNMREACDELFPATKGETPLSDSLIEPNFYMFGSCLPTQQKLTDFLILI